MRTHGRAADGADSAHQAELDLLAARLRQAVGRLARIIRTDSRESVPPLQLAMLVTIGRYGPLLSAELVRLEAVRASTVSRAVTSLERRGLVSRQPDPEDSRRMIIALTRHGAEALDDVRRQRTAVFARRLACLPRMQREALSAAMPALEHMFLADDAVGYIEDGQEGRWRVGHDLAQCPGVR